MSETRPVLGDPLTDTEIAVLAKVAAGLGNAGAGQALYLATDTVKHYLRRAFVRLGARDRSHLVALAFQHGYLWVGVDGHIHHGLPRNWRLRPRTRAA